MKRAPHTDVATLPAALRWVETHWSEQPAPPVRIHVHEVNPSDLLGAPKMAPAFVAYLSMSGDAMTSVSVQQTCYHPSLPQDHDGTLRGILCACVHQDCERLHCPDCMGMGVRTMTADRYTYPMRVAIDRLSREPRWYAVILALARHGWDTARAGVADEDALRAIRKLHGRYASVPVRGGRSSSDDVPWTQMSESQQRAEVAA